MIVNGCIEGIDNAWKARDSKAMHLLQAGVNLVYIRDILGHISVQTTEIYARADSMQKRKALEKAYVNVNPNEEPQWLKKRKLKSAGSSGCDIIM